MCHKRGACSTILCQQAGIVNILVRDSFFLNLLRYAISFSVLRSRGARATKGKEMAQIHCQSKRYRDINIFTFTEMSEDEAHEKLVAALGG